jgi:hypothetical protein
LHSISFEHRDDSNKSSLPIFICFEFVLNPEDWLLYN